MIGLKTREVFLKGLFWPPMPIDIYIPPDTVLLSKYSKIIEFHFFVAVILIKNF